MSYTNLNLFKKHVRADDFSEDDEYLQQCLDAAEEIVIRATHRSVEELLSISDGEHLPPSLTQAVLLVGGSMYDHRENDAPQQFCEIPIGATTIIKQYRKLCVLGE